MGTLKENGDLLGTQKLKKVPMGTHLGAVQYKLGKQYLWKKFTQPWESNPRPTPIRGELATIIVSVGLKKLVAIRHYIQVG